MTKYKQYMKDKYNMMFDEDYLYLPYNIDSHVVIEGRDIYPCKHGLIVIAVYNVDISRALYLPNGKRLPIYEDDERIPQVEILAMKRQLEIRIYHDFPHLHFYFDDDDNLIAVRYRHNTDYIG